jgi:hypothetical protein
MKRFQALENIVPVVADGGIAHPMFADRRMIPTLIVDCENCPQLVDLVRIHKDTPPGDVKSVWCWASLIGRREVYLNLEFVKPLALVTTIKFDVRTQGGLVEGILLTHAFYLQPASEAAKVSEGVGKPLIVVEVPQNVKPPGWAKAHLTQLVKRYVHLGYSRAQASDAAKEHIARAREFWSISMRPPKSNGPSAAPRND